MSKSTTPKPATAPKTDANPAPKAPLTQEEKLAKLNQKAKEFQIKQFKMQAETLVAYGWKDEVNIRQRIEAVRATLLQMEQSIQPELPM